MLCATIEVNDLHKFVSVALHTSAGEGDLSSDKLSHLKMVGSGFGPLIYGLENPDFDTFRRKCEAVWEAVKATPKLPRLLVRNLLHDINKGALTCQRWHRGHVTPIQMGSDLSFPYKDNLAICACCFMPAIQVLIYNSCMVFLFCYNINCMPPLPPFSQCALHAYNHHVSMYT